MLGVNIESSRPSGMGSSMLASISPTREPYRLWLPREKHLSIGRRTTRLKFQSSLPCWTYPNTDPRPSHRPNGTSVVPPPRSTSLPRPPAGTCFAQKAPSSPRGNFRVCPHDSSTYVPKIMRSNLDTNRNLDGERRAKRNISSTTTP